MSFGYGFFCVVLKGIDDFAEGIYVKSGLVEMFKKYVDVEYDSEAPKRRSPNIGERRAKLKKKTCFSP